MPSTYGSIQTMAQAYQQICAGEDPWIALGNFRNAWYGYAKDIRSTLVHEPLKRPESETEHIRRWGAFCAASVEFLCGRYEIRCPSWVHDAHYILENPWWHTRHPSSSSIQKKLIQSTPLPFVQRNIFCGNRLYQNKYEMSAWVQEAKNKGMTSPEEIFRYARQKEMAIHGG